MGWDFSSPPQPADTRYFDGRLLELEGDAVGGIAAYDEALAIDPRHHEALFRLALNVDLRGEDEEARELYERALMIPPVNFACVMNLGILYEDMGNYRRAMQCFDLALQADPDTTRIVLISKPPAEAVAQKVLHQVSDRHHHVRPRKLRGCVVYVVHIELAHNRAQQPRGGPRWRARPTC